MSDHKDNGSESIGYELTSPPREAGRSSVSLRTVIIDDVLRARTGDQSAFDRLVRSYQDAAVAYAIARLDGSDFDLARDAAQGAFVDAWLHLGALRDTTAFGAWLRRIVRKHCDRLTRGKGARPTSLDAAFEVSAPPESADPVLAAESRDLSRRVWVALSALPSSERAVVLLYYFDSHSHNEIGGFLGIAAKTVKSRLHTARCRLRERMKDMIDDEIAALVDASLEKAGSEMRPSRDGRFADRVAALIVAIDSRDTATVATLIAETPELANSRTPRPFWEGQVRALHAAVEAGNVDAARALIDAGADVNASTDEHNWKPLHLALAGHNAEMVNLLLGAGATVDVFAASGLGDAQRLRELLAADPTLARSSGGPDGATPLHFAADETAADVLLAAGADIDSRDAFHDCTPLTWLTSAGNTKVATFLLARGAQVDFWTACSLNLSDALTAFLDREPERVTGLSPERNVLRLGFPAYALHIAARYGSMDAAAILLRAGADVAARSSDGSLPIHDAAYMGHVAMVEFLVDHGSPINEREALYNATPLGVAEYAGRTDAAAFLRSRGGEV